jgi:hypothetical protein
MRRFVGMRFTLFALIALNNGWASSQTINAGQSISGVAGTWTPAGDCDLQYWSLGESGSLTIVDLTKPPPGIISEGFYAVAKGTMTWFLRDVFGAVQNQATVSLVNDKLTLTTSNSSQVLTKCPAAQRDDQIVDKLIGTWSTNKDSCTNPVTFNKDGTTSILGSLSPYGVSASVLWHIAPSKVVNWWHVRFDGADMIAATSTQPITRFYRCKK